jgi:hypothetical protein
LQGLEARRRLENPGPASPELGPAVLASLYMQVRSRWRGWGSAARSEQEELETLDSLDGSSHQLLLRDRGLLELQSAVPVFASRSPRRPSRRTDSRFELIPVARPSAGISKDVRPLATSDGEKIGSSVECSCPRSSFVQAGTCCRTTREQGVVARNEGSKSCRSHSDVAKRIRGGEQKTRARRPK